MKLLLFLITLPALAQVESVRIRSGDDLQWAQPGFDDSDWAVRTIEATDGVGRDTEFG